MSKINKNYLNYYGAVKSYARNPYQTNSLGAPGQQDNRHNNSARNNAKSIVSPATVIHISPEAKKI